MVNFLEAYKLLIKWLMKIAGLTPYTVEIKPGTAMKFWVPTETINKSKNDRITTTIRKPSKPVVVLLHGFAADGTVTWQFQVGSLTKHYSVYVPDLLFFGGSTSDRPYRSPTFQAECMVEGLMKLRVDKCTVVGFSYGGMVAFKMAELYTDFVRALVVTGSILDMTDSISDAMLHSLGLSSFAELLLPTSVKGVKAMLSFAAHKKLWFPDRFYKDFLEVMFNYRKERGELLEAMIVSNTDTTVPNFPQRILLLWGENDQIFNFELAQKMMKQLGDKATFRGIKKAGHLVHIERPFVFNKCLKQFLASLQANEAQE